MFQQFTRVKHQPKVLLVKLVLGNPHLCQSENKGKAEVMHRSFTGSPTIYDMVLTIFDAFDDPLGAITTHAF